MRTIIDLPESDRDSLDALSRRLGISRAAAVRQAVSEYLKTHRPARDDELFGIWRKREEDSLDYEDRIRAEWQRR
ncbi:MAG: ribbon-helix-helix protein, CopG family [Xanthomonadaceae bacterium]|nr:ribbon-helix-helix protein, CopG family [Xanthomonadaceae bacterium]